MVLTYCQSNQNKVLRPPLRYKLLSEYLISFCSKLTKQIVFCHDFLSVIHAIPVGFWGKRFQYLFPFLFFRFMPKFSIFILFLLVCFVRHELLVE